MGLEATFFFFSFLVAHFSRTIEINFLLHDVSHTIRHGEPQAVFTIIILSWWSSFEQREKKEPKEKPTFSFLFVSLFFYRHWQMSRQQSHLSLSAFYVSWFSRCYDFFTFELQMEHYIFCSIFCSTTFFVAKKDVFIFKTLTLVLADNLDCHKLEQLTKTQRKSFVDTPLFFFLQRIKPPSFFSLLPE